MTYNVSKTPSIRTISAVAITLVLSSSAVIADLADNVPVISSPSIDIPGLRVGFTDGRQVDVRCHGERQATGWQRVTSSGAGAAQRVIRSRCVLYQQGEPANRIIL